MKNPTIFLRWVVPRTTHLRRKVRLEPCRIEIENNSIILEEP